ncbi:SDR family NAD(P)-dependent oxidoreductase [Chelatococcus reniformis]|uniref:Beta-ketoacyl-ACP reductase n=1 Tax=Chelatococcus reniformis TaxID=1494448 RepID=A0A916XKV2_9HYPH|nr:SDR family oxidoreductase [Chelatococcus reniformis]GGC82441.1 beta-ketoacyl-ACP reductase [Chelatococcus reniformis]
MAKLTGKVALVTGSGRGIGRAIALKLASEGASVVVNDLDAEPGDAVAAEIKDGGGKAIAVNGSVTEAGFADRFVNAGIEAFGGLDIIVNNAGYTWDATVQKMTDDMFQAMVDVHLVAPFRLLRAASEPIRAFSRKEAEAGQEVFRKVVNISSIAGLYGNAGQASYSSAKASLIGLTRTMCKEWGRYKVNVNCVAFGLIETRLTQAIEQQQPQKTIDVDGREIKVGVQSQMLDTMARMIPLGRAGKPEEAANAVYLFCSPESDYISGQVVVCGGGLLI